jgi:sugar/nucleoside kinase (ribokinase family)
LNNYDDGMNAVVWQLLDQTHSRGAIITLGEEGAIAFDRMPVGDQIDWHARIAGEHVPALSPYAVDPLGCGDSLLAAATLTLARGASFATAAAIGSVAAAVQVQRVGNAVIGAADLRRGIQRLSTARLALTGAPATKPMLSLVS